MKQNKEEIIAFLKNQGPMCDDCLSHQTGIEPRQTINTICRDFAKPGVINRSKTTCPICGQFKIVNRFVEEKQPEVKHEWELIPEETEPPSANLNDRSWYWEGNVQKRIVEYLVAQGYEIIQEVDTASKEQGIDIIARNKGGKLLLVTVKGYPSPKSSPYTQSRHWFSQAIFDLILYRQEHPGDDLAVGMPAGFTSYKHLAKKITWFKVSLPFIIYWVCEDGHVEMD